MELAGSGQSYSSALQFFLCSGPPLAEKKGYKIWVVMRSCSSFAFFKGALVAALVRAGATRGHHLEIAEENRNFIRYISTVHQVISCILAVSEYSSQLPLRILAMDESHKTWKQKQIGVWGGIITGGGQPIAHPSQLATDRHTHQTNFILKIPGVGMIPSKVLIGQCLKLRGEISEVSHTQNLNSKE